MMFLNKKLLLIFIMFGLMSFIYTIPPSYANPEELKVIINEWVKSVENGLPAFRPVRSDKPIPSTKVSSIFHILTPAKFFDSLFTVGNVQMIMPNKPLSKNEEAKKFNKLTATFGR